MHPALLSLILIAVVRVCMPVGCAPPRLRGPETLVHRQQSDTAGAHADTSSSDGAMRRNPQRRFLVILPVRTQTSNFVSIFDLRRKRFMCVNSEAELFTSRQRDGDDCLFQHIWSERVKHRHMFYSTSAGRLLTLEGAELRVAHRDHPEPSSGLRDGLQGPQGKRRRRSEEVNPSDPLRTESHTDVSHTARIKDADHGQPDQDQAGAVSKETITSCDDPLRVLRLNGAISPLKTNIAERAGQD